MDHAIKSLFQYILLFSLSIWLGIHHEVSDLEDLSVRILLELLQLFTQFDSVVSERFVLIPGSVLLLTLGSIGRV